MSWRTEQQRGDVARTLLRSLHREDLWTEDGPTAKAVELLEADGGPMSSGERVMLLAAFDVWNGQGHARLDEVMYSLDPERLRLVASLLLALAEGGAAIDRWLEFQGTIPHPWFGWLTEYPDEGRLPLEAVDRADAQRQTRTILAGDDPETEISVRRVTAKDIDELDDAGELAAATNASLTVALEAARDWFVSVGADGAPLRQVEDALARAKAKGGAS